MNNTTSSKAQKLVQENYKFLDYLYKSQSVEKGKAMKAFINDLFQNVFLLNCELINQYGTFPISDESENGSYASIAAALYAQTPFVMSEVNLNFTESKKKNKVMAGARSVDFWCARNSANNLTNLEIWFEVKKLQEYNITNAQDKFTTRDEEMVQKALKQIVDVKEHRPATTKTNAKTYAVALLNIPVRYSINRAIEPSIIDNAPKKVLEILQKIVNDQKHNMHILCGYMDFGKEVQKAMKKDECFLEWDARTTHYVMMCAVVLDCE